MLLKQVPPILRLDRSGENRITTTIASLLLLVARNGANLSQNQLDYLAQLNPLASTFLMPIKLGNISDAKKVRNKARC